MAKKATKKAIATLKAAATRATRRAPAAAVVTQAQARDWKNRLNAVAEQLASIGSAVGATVQMAQQRDSLIAQLAGVYQEIDGALDRAD